MHNPVDAVWKEVEHDPLRPGGEVLDVLHPWYGPSSIAECGHPGTQAKYRPLHVTGMNPRYDPDGASTLPWVTHAAPTLSPKIPSHEYKLFTSLSQAVPKTKACERTHASWILGETWRVIYARVSLWKFIYRCQWRLCVLGYQVQYLMNRD